jgi:hypothetical protein
MKKIFKGSKQGVPPIFEKILKNRYNIWTTPKPSSLLQWRKFHLDKVGHLIFQNNIYTLFAAEKLKGQIECMWKLKCVDEN